MLKLSVCMPVYNQAMFIRDSIESVLSQTFSDFEFLIVDDGSTDDTCDIIMSYKDPRIRLIRNNHDYIGTLNLLLKEACGKYIARMDSDDIMLPDRLSVQYDYMESHQYVDVMGAGMLCFGSDEYELLPYCDSDLGIQEFIEACHIINPTSIIRKCRIDEFGLRYNPDYIYAEDYHFWAQAAICGLRIRNINKILIKYRVSHFQVTSLHCSAQKEATEKVRKELSLEWFKRMNELISRPEPIKAGNNELTVIIPFFNEAEEVGNTLRSIRETVGDEVDIIVINDSSTDDYEYESEISQYNVEYICNPIRIGSSASKEKGVRCCKSKCFLLLDAHMRFYRNDWHKRILEELYSNDNQLLCCQTKVLKKENGVVCEKAYVNQCKFCN